MKKTLLLLLLCCTFSVSSQNSDVIEKINQLIKDKTFSSSEVHKTLKKYRRNKEDMELLIKESKKASYNQGMFYGYNALGRIYRDISLFDTSINQYKKALEIAEKINDVGSELKTLNSIGSVYRRQDDIQNALNNHQEALDKALSVENPSLEIKKSISISQNSMGNIYLSLKQYNLALKEFSKSIVIQKEFNDTIGLAINYQNIGNANENLGNLEEALKNYYLSLKYNNLENSNTGRIICGYSIADVLIKKKEYKKALTTVDTVLKIAIDKKDMYYLTNTYNTLGLAQIHLNKLTSAEFNLKKALNIATEFNVQNVKARANENLALLYERKGNYKKAYNYYKKGKEEDAKTFNNRNLLYVSELTTKYDKERTENEIKNLAKQNEITQLQRERDRNIFILITSILGLLTIIGYSVTKQRGLQNEKKILTLKQEALQSQMNPHFIFNALNSIKLYIINNEQKNAAYYLNKFAKLIRKILDASKIREVSLQEEIETMKLYMSIENIRFNNEIDYNFNLDKALNLENIKIPPLVLQPFIENAIWHGLSSKEGNKKICISVEKNANEFAEIIIEDNGIGREASAKIKAKKQTNKKSFGIDLTTERLRSFKSAFGKAFSINYFDVKDSNNKIAGTKVSIRVPLS